MLVRGYRRVVGLEWRIRLAPPGKEPLLVVEVVCVHIA